MLLCVTTNGKALAQGLFIKYTGFNVVLVSSQPLPKELCDLEFVWQDNNTCLKLLGMFMGTELSLLLMGQALLDTLEDRLTRARKSPHILASQSSGHCQPIDCKQTVVYGKFMDIRFCTIGSF